MILNAELREAETCIRLHKVGEIIQRSVMRCGNLRIGTVAVVLTNVPSNYTVVGKQNYKGKGNRDECSVYTGQGRQ